MTLPKCDTKADSLKYCLTIFPFGWFPIKRSKKFFWNIVLSSAFYKPQANMQIYQLFMSWLLTLGFSLAVCWPNFNGYFRRSSLWFKISIKCVGSKYDCNFYNKGVQGINTLRLGSVLDMRYWYCDRFHRIIEMNTFIFKINKFREISMVPNFSAQNFEKKNCRSSSRFFNERERGKSRRSF